MQGCHRWQATGVPLVAAPAPPLLLLLLAPALVLLLLGVLAPLLLLPPAPAALPLLLGVLAPPLLLLAPALKLLLLQAPDPVLLLLLRAAVALHLLLQRRRLGAHYPSLVLLVLLPLVGPPDGQGHTTAASAAAARPLQAGCRSRCRAVSAPGV
jgi:hypothetical protein